MEGNKKERVQKSRKDATSQSSVKAKKPHKRGPPPHLHPNRDYNMFNSMNLLLDSVIFKNVKDQSIRQEAHRYDYIRFHLAQLKEENAQLHSVIRTMMNELIFSMYGTMMPKVKFSSYASSLVNMGIDFTSTTGSIQFVSALNISIMSGVGLWNAVFDEYKPVGPFSYKYYPRIIGATGYPTTNAPAANGIAWALGLIDYVDMSTAITTIPSGVFADTHKVFPLNPNGSAKNFGITEWHGMMLDPPDVVWFNVTNISQNFAAFKAIQAQNVYGTGTIYWGYITSSIEIQYRCQTTV